MNIKQKSIILLLDSSRGIYIPENFYSDFNLKDWHLDHLDLSVLSNPENELYWDAWQDVLDKAYYIKDGYTYTLQQDGDLWAICYELMSHEDKQNFGFEDI